MYASGVARRLVEAVSCSTSSLLTDVADYSTAVGSAGTAQRLMTPLSTPRSSPLATAAASATAVGPCRWTHLHQQTQQHGYGVLDDSVEDFALMASLVSASNSSSCDDILLKGP